MILEEDFFMSSNMPEIPEKEYRKVEAVIRAYDALSHITFQNLYVIDYYKRNFLYVSDNSLFLCGHTAREVKEMGFGFYLKHVPEDELAMLKKVYRAGFDFYRQLPAGEILGHTISYDFHILDEKQNEILVNHKLSPVLLTDDGRIWLAVCIVAPSTYDKPGHITLNKAGQATFWEYSLEYHQWKEKQKIALTERGKKVLLLAVQGYTMDEIADRLYVGLDTVKSCKRKLFEKLNVKNMMEALLFAENYKLL